MPDIQIEPTSPIVKQKTKVGRPSTYPWSQLTEKGMSFWLPSDTTTWTAIYVAVYRQNKKGKPQFVVTKGDKGERVGWRCQRVE